MNEMDLLSVEGNNILPLHYQVPREMCEHTAFMMPFHWNYRTGIGPLFLIKYEKPDTDTNDGGGNNNNNDDGQEEEKEECYLDLCAVGSFLKIRWLYKFWYYKIKCYMQWITAKQ